MEFEANTTKDEHASGSPWEKRFFDLVKLVRSYTWFDEREDFYESLAANLRGVSGADSVNIRLLTPAQDSFVLYAFHGDADAAINKQYDILSAETGRMPHLIETGEPIVFDFRNPTRDDVRWDRGADDGFSCAVIVALTGVQGIVGAADFLFHEAKDWSDSDIAWFRGLGDFVGATIGNALLSDNMFGLRIAEERRNLSNEIHDNVAQSVSVITLEVENALDSLAKGDEDALRHELDLIKRASDELETSVRNELANLKSGPGQDEESTMEQLDHVIETLCGLWGLECQISRSEQSRAAVVPTRIMVQLTRVVHEALVNVIRHANASKVVVTYEIAGGGLKLTVEDDGCGFDASRVSPLHFGLRIMSERLESIGATLDIASPETGGTQVTVVVPYLV